MSKSYGLKEFAFAAPFAEALVLNAPLRQWVVAKTKIRRSDKGGHGFLALRGRDTNCTQFICRSSDWY